MTRLLVCGSRETTPAMLAVAWRAVERAKARGFSIIVGDAGGIDIKVMLSACQLGVPFRCYGIYQLPRHICCMRHEQETGVYQRVPGSFWERDRVMVWHADLVFAIWNGRSRGTRYTYEYAVQSGKIAWIWREAR